MHIKNKYAFHVEIFVKILWLQLIIPKVRYSEGSNYSEGSLFWRFVIPKGRIPKVH